MRKFMQFRLENASLMSPAKWDELYASIMDYETRDRIQERMFSFRDDLLTYVDGKPIKDATWYAAFSMLSKLEWALIAEYDIRVDLSQDDHAQFSAIRVFQFHCGLTPLTVTVWIHLSPKLKTFQTVVTGFDLL